MSNNTLTYKVPGISCEHCKRAIEDHVGPVADVESVTVDVDAKTVSVIGGDPDAIEVAIEDAGYSVE